MRPERLLLRESEDLDEQRPGGGLRVRKDAKGRDRLPLRSSTSLPFERRHDGIADRPGLHVADDEDEGLVAVLVVDTEDVADVERNGVSESPPRWSSKLFRRRVVASSAVSPSRIASRNSSRTSSAPSSEKIAVPHAPIRCARSFSLRNLDRRR
jgi:hypothetical protein